MTLVQKLSERLKRGFGIEIIEFHRVNRKAIDRFSWWAFCEKEDSSMCITLGSYHTVKQLLKAKELYLLREQQVEPFPVVRDGVGWIKENES